jgi:hypothetical protein
VVRSTSSTFQITLLLIGRASISLHSQCQVHWRKVRIAACSTWLVLDFDAVWSRALSSRRAPHDAAVPSSLRLDLLDLLPLGQSLSWCIAWLSVYWSRAGVLIVEEPDGCFEVVALSWLDNFLCGTGTVAGLDASADSGGHRMHRLHHSTVEMARALLVS